MTSVDLIKVDDGENEEVFGDGIETVVGCADVEELGESHTPPAAMNCSAFNDVPPTASRQEASEMPADVVRTEHPQALPMSWAAVVR